jgi:hypothetical protein
MTPKGACTLQDDGKIYKKGNRLFHFLFFAEQRNLKDSPAAFAAVSSSVQMVQMSGHG